MNSLSPTDYSKSQIIHMVNSMNMEEMAWTIRLITNRMVVFSSDKKKADKPHPSWWNRPLSEDTLSLIPQERHELGDDDYNELLAEALEEKYL